MSETVELALIQNAVPILTTIVTVLGAIGTLLTLAASKKNGRQIVEAGASATNAANDAKDAANQARDTATDAKTNLEINTATTNQIEKMLHERYTTVLPKLIAEMIVKAVDQLKQDNNLK